MMPGRRASKAILFAALGGAALVAGCASTDEELRRELRAERTEGLTIVSRADVAAQPANSPGRMVMVLWRAVQYRDAKGAIALLAPRPPRESLPAFEKFVAGGGAVIAESRMPAVIDVKQTGERARVIVELLRTRRVSSQVTTEVTGRLTLDLVKTESGWKVRWRGAVPQIVRAVS
jgi:hypothetical protein